MPSTTVVVRRFLMVWMALFAFGAAMAIMGDKLVLHAAMNQHHAPWSDLFFRVLTLAADGWTPTLLAFVLLFIKDVRSFMMLGLSCGVSAIIAQFLKRQVFPEMDRPSMFREQLGTMDWVSGIDLHQHFSFPSGHSTAAFSMCLALAVVIGNRKWAVPMVLLAAGMAYSRIHLSQHFLQDTVAGSAVGVLTAVAIHHWLYRSDFAKKSWLARRPFAQNQ
jgi:membrane-associated phospholipid phosphatase